MQKGNVGRTDEAADEAGQRKWARLPSGRIGGRPAISARSAMRGEEDRRVAVRPLLVSSRYCECDPERVVNCEERSRRDGSQRIAEFVVAELLQIVGNDVPD